MSLNDYEILKQIGTGAFSTVSLVKSKKDNLIYALKSVELNKMQQKEKDNSLNEIRLLASINHKNIIAYKESFYEEQTNTLNLILEYADGGDLQSKISAHKNLKKYFDEKIIWSLFIQMLQGIKALHDKNIVHRDLKSANIFLMKNGICKLGDLNVSKEVKSDLLKTQTGTPYFASPEVWGGKPYGLKSDIWSLGCILYQMTTLKMPFKGNNFKEVYNNVLKCKYDPLPKIYSNDLNIIIKKMLQIDPDERPSAQEILDDPIIKEKIQLLKAGNIDIKIDNNNTLINDINEEFINGHEEIYDKCKTHIKINNLRSRILKTTKYDEYKENKVKNVKNINNNNFRIFKNYDTNPTADEDEKLKEKYNNRKSYSKSNIDRYKKYRTINDNFMKSNSNLTDKIDIKEIINKNGSNNNNYKLTEQNIITPSNINKEENKIKMPFLNSRSNLNKKGKSIPRNCSSAKPKKRALSENRPNKYYNYANDINNQNNYQYKKILLFNLNNDNNNIKSNINMTQKKRKNVYGVGGYPSSTGVTGGYGHEFSQTDIDNKETNNTSGKSIVYGKNLENKFHFNLSSKQKQKEKHFHSLSKIKNKQDFFDDKDNNVNFYNKKNIKSIPKGYSNNKNFSNKCHPVKPNIKISNLMKEFNDTQNKTNSKDKFDNTFNKQDIVSNNLTLKQIYMEKNNIKNEKTGQLKNMKHKNYTVIGAKLSLPNKKFQNHRKIFRKSFNNLKILENIDNENDNNKNIYSKTSSKRITNIKSKNDRNNLSQNKFNKYIKDMNNTQSNKTNYNIRNKNFSKDFNIEESNSFYKKISSFKFGDFKSKRLKRNNHDINNRKKLLINFQHIPFIKTVNKEKENKENDEKGKEEMNKNIDPTIKMLINPIKIVEKKNFKRKLLPVHPHIKLNKLNLLNNMINKTTNQEIETTMAHNEI